MVAPGAKVDHTPLLAVASGDAAAPNGPGTVRVSAMMPVPPLAICTAGAPCMSLTLTLVMATLPVLVML
jgi:hypothetical protein